MDKAYLIKKRTLLLEGIKNTANSNEIIPFDNMELQLGTGEDPNRVVIPTVGEINDIINNSSFATDKQNVGTVEVGSILEIDHLVEQFNLNGSLTFTDGTTYNNSMAKTGDIVFFTKNNATLTLLPEQAIVLKDLSMVLLTQENAFRNEIDDISTDATVLESRVTDVETDELDDLNESNDKDVITSGSIDHTTEDYKIATREDVRQYGASVVVDIEGSNRTKTITQIEDDDKNMADRIEAIENAETLEDKIWNGDLPFSSTGEIDMSTITDGAGVPFTFTDNKVFELYIKSIGGNVGVGHSVTVGDTTGVAYVIPTGAQSDTLSVKVDNTGKVTGVITNGNDNIDDFSAFRLIEKEAAKAISTAYSKSESDAKYASRALEINKQDKQDISLSTGDKTIVGAINELKNGTQLYDKLLEIQVDNNRQLKDMPNDKTQTKNILSTEDYVNKHFPAHLAYKQSDGSELRWYPQGHKEIWVNGHKTSTDTVLFKSDTSGVIAYYEGQHIDFIKEQPSTSYFENSTLFKKTLWTDKHTKLGGDTYYHEIGHNKTHSHSATQAAHKHDFTLPFHDENSFGDFRFYTNGRTSSTNDPKHHSTDTAHPGITIGNQGNADNIPTGIEMLKVTYVALKDITWTELGKVVQGIGGTGVEKSYVDTQDGSILAQANAYTDAHTSTGGVTKVYVDDQDTAKLTEAKTYADGIKPDYVKQGDDTFQQRVTGAGNFETWAGANKVSSEVIAVESKVDTKIATALSTTLTFTYDDGTSEDIKVGK